MEYFLITSILWIASALVSGGMLYHTYAHFMLFSNNEDRHYRVAKVYYTLIGLLTGPVFPIAFAGVWVWNKLSNKKGVRL